MQTYDQYLKNLPLPNKVKCECCELESTETVRLKESGVTLCFDCLAKPSTDAWMLAQTDNNEAFKYEMIEKAYKLYLRK